MGEAIAVFIPLLYGYALALVLSLVFTFGCAKFFRNSIVDANGNPLWGYSAVSGLAWFLSGLSACWVSAYFAPFSPEIYLVGMLLILTLFLLNVVKDVGPQQKRGTLVVCCISLALGAASAWQLLG